MALFGFQHLTPRHLEILNVETLGERLKQESSDSRGYELRVTTSKKIQIIVRDIAPLKKKVGINLDFWETAHLPDP